MKHRLPPPALLALATVVVAAIVAAIVVRPEPDDIEALFDGGGALGPLLFAAAYALLTVVLFPGAPLTLAAGALYGVAGGALVSVVGATIGATAAFALAKRGTRPAVERVRGARLAAIEARLSGRGLLALLVLRLIPIVPFSALNYAAGASKIGTRDYLIATAVGIVPGAVLYAALGAGLEDPLSPLFVVAAVLAVALALVTRKVTSSRGPAAGGGPKRPVGSGTPSVSAAAGDRTLSRLAWSTLFFLVALGGFAALAAGGLLH